MRKICVILVFTFLSIGSNAQDLIGAWEAFSTSDEGDKLKNIVIFSEGYQVSTWYHAKTGKFIKTNGGSWKRADDTVTEKVEFDTENSERVGTEISFKIRMNDTILSIADKTLKWRRIDSGTPGKLNGAWLMSGRKRDGKIQSRDTERPRKTMKILSGTRFQWIAYNTATKQFMGTGGGTYTTKNGNYVESIDFFSRDNSKVGLSLNFEYRLVDGTWHHSGLSSKGAPIYEIWSQRK